jgi:hypothetical protein
MEYQHRLPGRLDSLVPVIDPILNILESRDKTKVSIPFLCVATIWKEHTSTSNHGYTRFLIGTALKAKRAFNTCVVFEDRDHARFFRVYYLTAIAVASNIHVVVMTGTTRMTCHKRDQTDIHRRGDVSSVNGDIWTR